MKTLNLIQGSAAWHEHRGTTFGASEAPIMMGASRHTTRNELLHMRATGTTREFSEWVQRNVLGKGHAAEAAVRPKIAAMIGDDLFPATGVSDKYPHLSASFDGITMCETTGFECKLWNEELVMQVREKALDDNYYWQLEQQILVGNLERVIFVVADETASKFEWMEYRPVPGRADALLRGWAQFEKDLAAYKPVEVLPAPVVQQEMLPAVSVQVGGSLQIVSNLDVFGAALKNFIERIDKKPSTDEAFAEAEAAIKTLEKAQSALEAAKASGLAQVASVDDMVRTVDSYTGLARDTRLMLEKLVKARKDEIRADIVLGGKNALRDHIDQINKTLGKIRLPEIAADFAGVIRGKKTLSSLRNAVDTELARAKIEADRLANGIRINLDALRELAVGYETLFMDAQTLVTTKAEDDLRNLIAARIAEHKAKEEAKVEAERERIRAEEEAKAKAEAERLAEQERARIRAEERERAEREAAERLAAQQAPPTEAAPENTPISNASSTTPEVTQAPVAAAATATAPIASCTSADADDNCRITLGDIATALGFSLPAAFLERLGFAPVAQERSAKLYRHSDFEAICEKLASHINSAKTTGIARISRQAA